MARPKIRLDHPGIAGLLKSREMQMLVRGKASEVAKNVNAQGHVAESGSSESGAELRAEVQMSVTDRAHATVVVPHPAAEAFQAKYGLLTKAAAQAGLEVRDK